MKYSREEYYSLANADCISVAKALGMQVDEGKQTTPKAVHIRHSGGLYIFPEKNNWYRHSDGRKGFPVDLVMDTLQYLREHSEITSVVLSLDNDQAGNKGANAIDEKIRTEFTEREITISRVLSQGKDWNEDLIAFRIAEKSGVSVNEFLKSAYPQVESSNYSFQQYKEG